MICLLSLGTAARLVELQRPGSPCSETYAVFEATTRPPGEEIEPRWFGVDGARASVRVFWGGLSIRPA